MLSVSRLYFHSTARETKCSKMKMAETSDIFNSMTMLDSQHSTHHSECSFEIMMTLRSCCDVSIYLVSG